MPRKKKPGSTVSSLPYQGGTVNTEDPYLVKERRPFPPTGGNLPQKVPGGAERPVTDYPPNILDPSAPGYPTTNPGPAHGGGYVPGPGHPAYPYPPPDLHGPGGIPGFANGGDFITNGPQTIMVGEGGPERVQVQPLGGAPGQGGGYAGPPVMGPGQGMLPLPDRGSSADDFFGPFGTGQRGTGPSPSTGTGPFEQTYDDFSNLWEYGTTTPHWSEQQMLKAYGMSPFRALLNRPEAERSITSAEVDRIFRNVTGGLGHYAGQMVPSLFGGGDAGGQWSVPPAGRMPGQSYGTGPTLSGQRPPNTSVPGGTHAIGPGHPAYPYPPGDAGPPPAGISQEAFDEFNRGMPGRQADEAEEFMRPIPPAPPLPPGQRPGVPGGGGGFGPAMRRKRQALINLLRGRKPPPKKPPSGLSDLF